MSSIFCRLALASKMGVWAEKNLARAEPPVPVARRPASVSVYAFFAAVVLLALGFQVHSALNAAPLYLRFASAAELEQLMPVFWIGFGVLMVPAQWAAKRFGAVPVMAASGAAGAAAAWLAAAATSLDQLVAWQFMAGGAWGAVSMSASAAAIAVGRTGREGMAAGGLCALLALAIFARMAVVAGQWHLDPAVAGLLGWLPAALWALATLILGLLAAQVAIPEARQAPA